MRRFLLNLVVSAAFLLPVAVRAEETPVTEAPVTEAPITEAPVTESPVTEAPPPPETPEAASTEPAAAERPRGEGINVFKAIRKGGRGITNIATSPLEIPNQMVKEAKRHNTFAGQAGGYLTGIPIGCGWMLYRCGTGLFDLLTFPFPMPTYDKSYIQPEFLFPAEPYLDAELK